MEYHAQCWAESKTCEEIQVEIDRVAKFKNYSWDDTGNACLQYRRLQTLRAILHEKTHD